MAAGYKYKISECDVENCKALAIYRAMRQRWLHWLNDDDQHAVWKQIYAMTWSDAVFRTVNEARRFSTPTDPTAASNGMLAEFIDLGYVATQTVAIWRLMDDRDDVISLRRVLDSISRNRHLITREIYVAHDGLPYDPAAAQARYYAGWTVEQMEQFHGLPTEGPDAFGTSDLLHTAFDRLSGKSPEKRSRTDTIDPRVFDTLQAWLNDPVFQKLITIRHNFVAHAADEKSRAATGLDKIGVTLGEIERAHTMLVKTAEVITSQLLYDAHHGQVVPIPQLDQLGHLDKPFAPPTALGELSGWWHKHMDDRAKWTKGSFDLIPKT